MSLVFYYVQRCTAYARGTKVVPVKKLERGSFYVLNREKEK